MKKYLNSSLMVMMSIVIFSSCKSAHQQDQGKLGKIKIGMSYTDVLNMIGFPDEKIDLGNSQDSLGNQTHSEEWRYGDNQSIMIVNDTVNSIDYDRKKTMEKIQHIIDSARAAGNGNFEIQPVHP